MLGSESAPHDLDCAISPVLLSSGCLALKVSRLEHFGTKVPIPILASRGKYCQGQLLACQETGSELQSRVVLALVHPLPGYQVQVWHSGLSRSHIQSESWWHFFGFHLLCVFPRPF